MLTLIGPEGRSFLFFANHSKYLVSEVFDQWLIFKVIPLNALKVAKPAFFFH